MIFNSKSPSLLPSTVFLRSWLHVCSFYSMSFCCITRMVQVPSRLVKVKEVPHEEHKKTVVALHSKQSPSPADREGLNSHDSLHSVCVQGCRLSDVWACGLGSVWAGCVDLHLRHSRFILRWQKTHLSQAEKGYLVPCLTCLECGQE